MPLVRVYMHPCGRNVCLPCEPMKSVVGSHTLTISSFAPFLTRSVTSYAKGICPPSCGTPASRPFTNTCVRKSHSSKLRTRRSPFFTSASNVRRYQSVSFGSSRRPTPESGLSIGNGTRISPSHLDGIVGASVVTAYFHSPFRFVQFARTICGRGYSRHAFSGVTFAPHSVSIGAPAVPGVFAGCHANIPPATQAAARTIVVRLLISIFLCCL